MASEFARLLDRHDLVAFGVQHQDRSFERLDGGAQVPVLEQLLERRQVGVELESLVRQPAAQTGDAGRADRDDRGCFRQRGRKDRQTPAHARPAQRNRSVRAADPHAQQRGHRRDVGERSPIQRTVARAVASLVESDRREPGREHKSRVVVMALLAGIRAVQDHDPALRPPSGSQSE